MKDQGKFQTPLSKQATEFRDAIKAVGGSARIESQNQLFGGPLYTVFFSCSLQQCLEGCLAFYRIQKDV